MALGHDAISRVRIVHAVFVITIFFFVLVCRLSAPPEQPVSNMTLIPMGLVAVGDIAIGSARRRRYLQDCQDFFKAEANLRKALGRWYMGNIVSFVHAETVALFGLR